MDSASLLLWLLLLNVGLLFNPIVSEEINLSDLEEGGKAVKSVYEQLTHNASPMRRSRLSQETYAKLSQPCGRHNELMEAAAEDPTGYPWTLLWEDSKGKFPEPGALLGNHFGVGSYDECYKVKASGDEVFYQYKNGTNTSLGIHNFDTHYCKGTYRFEDNPVGFAQGWCVAESCGPEDVKVLMPWYPYASKYVYCGAKQPIKDNPGAIVALVISSFFVGLVLVATIFDGIRAMTTASDNADSSMPTSEVTGQTNGAYELAEIELQSGIRAAGPDDQTFTPTSNKVTKILNLGQRVLVSFSLYRTLPTVLDTGGARAAYRCFNGLRFIAMTWIILGHTWQLDTFTLTDPRNVFVENFVGQFDFIDRYGHNIINNMSLSVEIFFFLGAILVTLSLIKTFKCLKDVSGCGRFKEMLLYVCHRYWRLTPVFAAVMLIYGNLWQYWGSGPVFPEFSHSADSCKHLWWNNLLYIQNLYRGDCMGWTWYLAIDFQFYLAAPLFVFLLYWKPVVGSVVISINWVAGLVIRGLLYHFGVDAYWFIYVKPYARFGPYAQGITMGYLIYRTQCKVKLPRAVVIVGWLVAIFLALSAVLGSYGFKSWPTGLQIFYASIQGDVFTLSMAWTVFACITGYGGLLNTFLSWNIFTPLSKLTYCGYLIHPIVQFVSLANRKRLFYVQDVTMIYQYLGNLCLTLICSLGLTLVFEVPFLALEKVILPSRRK